jgi:hypothetical protein
VNPSLESFGNPCGNPWQQLIDGQFRQPFSGIASPDSRNGIVSEEFAEIGALSGLSARHGDYCQLLYSRRSVKVVKGNSHQARRSLLDQRSPGQLGQGFPASGQAQAASKKIVIYGTF